MRQLLTTIKRWSLGVVFVLALSPLLGAVYTYTRAGEGARVHAATASTMNFQARLMSSTGSLVSDGTYSIEFKLYDAVSGGTNEWTETQTVTAKNGYFNVYLGNVTPFSGSIDWSQEKWLTMNINSDGEMTPRIKLTATPYSLRSGQADSLTITGGAITGDNLFQKAPGAVQLVNSANAGLRLNQTGSGGLLQLQGNGADVFTVDKSGNTVTAGSLVIGNGLTLGNSTSTTAGTLRWNGTQFEGFDGLTWAALGSGGVSGSNPIINKAKTANEIVNNSIVFQDDDQLFFAVGANETWTYRFVVQANAAAAADLKFAVTAPLGATCVVGTDDPEGATSVGNLGCGVSTGLVAGNAAVDVYEVTGTITNGATAGVARLQWAQNTANVSNTTVFAGSYVTAVRAAGGSGSTVASIQDGNTLGSALTLGTNDNFGLNLETNGVTGLTLGTNGDLDIINGALQTAGTTRITNAGVLQNVTANTNILTSGTLGVDRGGTGVGTFTTNGLVFGNGTSALGVTAAGTGGQLLIADGSGVPTFVSLGGDATLDSAGSLTIANGTIGNTKLANSSFNVAYGSNISGDASVSLGGTLNLSISATPSFTSVSSGTVTSTGAITGATTVDTINGLIINSGALSGITGMTFTSGGLNLNSGGITNAGAISGVAGLTLSSGNLALGGGNITGAGSIAGTSLGVTGVISANTTNTINGLNINSGSLSGITGFGQASGIFSISGTGTIDIGAGSNALTINSTNFDVSSTGALSGITTIGLSGAITGATTVNTINGLIINSGSLSGATGFSQTSGDFSVTGSGNITLGAGSSVFSIDSSNFDVSTGGALSGITTIGASGAITAATAANTLNGLVVNSGSLSSITGFNQGSGNFAMTGAGTFGTGSGDVSLNGATAIATNTNAATALTVNGTTGTAADALRIAQTGNAANLVMTNTARTAGSLISLTQSTSAFTGTGLLFNFAAGSGSFASGNFLDFQLNGLSRFKIDNTGALQLNTDSTAALQIRSASGTVSFFSVNNTGNLVQVGSTTADAANILFILDHATSDPTGVNGGSYYNTTDGTNRCYESGVWSDCSTTKLLGETTLGAANGTITVTLSRSVETLSCRINTVGGSVAHGIYMRFNGDNGAAAYGWNVVGSNANSGTAVQNNADNSDSEIQLTAATTSNNPMNATIDITSFSATRKAVNWVHAFSPVPGTNQGTFTGGGVWNNTAAQITSVSFLTSAGTFNTGSNAYCEGRNVR